jgi:DHA1 family bicyclomycin/chloramphenicol resistance-like MFS transporter
VIGTIFIGMTLGQLMYGPVSDRIGRKPALYIGLGLFIIGCLISWGATSLPVMLVGRFIQGIGVAGPRIVTVAIVRDRFQGRDMAYVMSMVMGVFILVPAVAPSIGQVIIHAFDWRMIFLFYILMTLMGLTWAHFRLKETLAPENRRALDWATFFSGIKEAARTRVTMGYTLCSGLAFGALLGYLNSSQQIFQDIFQAGDMFAIYFGMLALAIGAAFFSNSMLVRTYGMRAITKNSLYLFMASATFFLPYSIFMAPSLVVFLVFAGVSFFALGLMFGNMNAMAMEPMGHMAGMAAAFIGAFSSAISAGIGTFIGQMYDGSVIPMAIGFFVLAYATYGMMFWAEKGHITAHHSAG